MQILLKGEARKSEFYFPHYHPYISFIYKFINFLDTNPFSTNDTQNSYLRPWCWNYNVFDPITVIFQFFLESGKRPASKQMCLASKSQRSPRGWKTRTKDCFCSISGQILLKVPEIFQSQSSALWNKAGCSVDLHFSLVWSRGKEDESTSLGILLWKAWCVAEDRKTSRVTLFIIHQWRTLFQLICECFVNN